MTSAEFHSLASTVYGARWQSQLSRDMGIALRTIQRWARDGIDKTATAEGVRRFLEERRVSRMAYPPEGTTPEDDRDDACYEAVRPSIMAIMAAATDIGWSEAETLTAILSTIVEHMRAGDEATATTLRAAVTALSPGVNS